MNLSSELSIAPKSDRYEIHSLIGRGATSLVYRAFDLDKNCIVALKSLRFPEPDYIYHLKSEFRSLAHIYHPNLAQLYDLMIDESNCFITMELIEGSDFVSFVRGPPSAASRRGPDVDAVRKALGHLARGLTALHAAGKVHRDIKPTNILVEPSGRAVLVDFGLAMDRSPDSMNTRSLLNAGTLAYMSPERLEGPEGAPASEASDWYSVGAMLYEALVGTLPFRAETQVGLYKAQKRPPIPPHKLNEKIPTDLSELSLALLHRDPKARAGAAEVAALASSATNIDEPGLSAVSLEYGRKAFVGRAAEEKRLRQAFDHSFNHNVLVLVEGVSGVGKTTLIEHFASAAYDSRKALVLRSRCHFQELVAYNGIDGIVDNLSRYLVLQSSEDLADAAPAHLNALFKVFPVLGRVPFPNRFRLQPLPTDPQVVLARGRGALRHLLAEVAKTRPLIAWIDDAQWCDLASISLLKEVFTGPEAPSNLLLLSFRSEERSSNEVLSLLSGANPDGLPAADEHLTLSPLAESDIKTFMSDIGLMQINGHADVVRRICEETGGLPFFVVELAHHYRSRPSSRDTTEPINVGSMLKDRLVSLPSPLRSLLEIVAVSSGPLDEAAAVAAAGESGAGAAAIYRLCGEHLLRKTMVRGQWSLESYHDRIRKIVLDLIPPDALRRLHHRIAEALTRRPGVDPETLVEHYRDAGELLAAAEHAIVGGRSAAERLAFDRAAELFKLAVELRGGRKEDWPILLDEAQALANGGRPVNAAETYLEAAKKAKALRRDSSEISAVKVRAAEQFLTGGLLTKGLKHLCDVFADLKLPFPAGPRAAQLMSLKNRFRFWWLTRRVQRHELMDSPPEGFLRLDTLWVASRGMVMLDYVVGEAMTSWYLTEVARHRDRSRLLRALALELSVYANIGNRWSTRRSANLLQWAEDLLNELARSLRQCLDQAGPREQRLVRRAVEGLGRVRSCRGRATAKRMHRRQLGRRYEPQLRALGAGLSRRVSCT